MFLKKNIKVGKIKIQLFSFALILFFIFFPKLILASELEGNFTHIKILDKISSKNFLIKLRNGEDISWMFEDLCWIC